MSYQDRLPPQGHHDESSVLGGRNSTPTRSPVRQRPNGPPDGFTLFCAYHLGITLDDGYQEPSLDAVAKQFGMDCTEIEALLTEHQLDHQTIDGTDFDLHGAQIDIRLAPAGISRTETARDWYEEYLQMVPSKG